MSQGDQMGGEGDRLASIPSAWLGVLENRADEPFLKIPNLTRPSTNSYPYGAFYKRALRLSYVLREDLGLQPGEKVLLLSDDLNDVALICHACWLSGLVVAPLAPAASDKIVLQSAKLTRPAVFIYAHSFSAKVASVLSSSRSIKHWVVSGGARDARSQSSVTRLDDLVAGAAGEEFVPESIQSEWPALRVTKWNEQGEIRQLTFSHRALVLAARVASRFYPPIEYVKNEDGEDVMAPALSWSAMPPLSFEGILHAAIVPFFSRMPHLWTEHELPTKFWDQLQADGVTFALIDQALLRMVITRGKSKDWKPPRVDIQVYTEQRICYEAFERFEERFGLPLSCQYLKTEAGGTIAGFTVQEVRAKPSLWAQGYALPSIGYPAPEIEFVVENIAGKRLAPESPGELIIRSDYMMSSAEGHCQEYPAKDENGRLRTGDEGFYLSGPGGEHLIFVTGCLRDFIVIGDERVNPELVQCALLSIRGVSDASVFAFPNAHVGMELGAFVVPMGAAHLEEKTIMATLRRKVGPSQCPRKIVVEKLRGRSFPSKDELLKTFLDYFQTDFRA